MSGRVSPDLTALERELAYFRNEYNAVGSQLLRLQEEQSRSAREARRRRMVARLIREAYRIIDGALPAERIGPLILDTVADTSLCERAMILSEDPVRPGRFVVEHALAAPPKGEVALDAPPSFLFTASNVSARPEAAPLSRLLGVPFLAWSYDKAGGRALLIGNQTESNIHRAFETGDRELVEAALSVYSEVLQRKLGEIALRQAKLAAEEASNVRSRFLATLSHELRTPLNSIIGFSELLLDQGARARATEQHDEFLREILESGQGLLSLVNEILEFSTLSHAQPVVRLDWVSAGRLLQSSMGTFRSEIARRGTTMRLIPPAPGLQLRVDYDRFRRILHNIIGNAIKFTAADGEITVGIELMADGAAAVVVSDDGIGMREKDIERAFEPFVQIDNTLARRFKGSGLGLPIARQLAEAHGGALLIASVFGQGTTVTVTLPSGSVADAGAEDAAG